MSESVQTAQDDIGAASQDTDDPQGTPDGRHPGDRPEDRPSDRHRRWSVLVGTRSHLWPLLALAVGTVLIWAQPVFGRFTTARLSNPGDSASFEFYLGWNLHAIATWQDPFFTPNLYAPTGLDLGNAISVPAVSLLVAPVTVTLGVTAAYNVAFLLGIWTTAAAVYLLARRLFGSILGATGAGAMVTLSPYFAGHALGHLNLMWTFALPLICYVGVRAAQGAIRPRWIVVVTAFSGAFAMGSSTELAVTQAGFIVFAGIVALIFCTRQYRTRLVRSTPWFALGGVVAGVLSAPIVYVALRAGVPAKPFNPPSMYSIELTNLVVPTVLMKHGEGYFLAAATNWLGNGSEQTAFLPVTLIAFIVVYAIATRARVPAALAVFVIGTTICGFGPFLTINGVATIPMPWYLTDVIPGLNHALPVRFTAFSYMAMALMVAHAWASRALPRWFTASTLVGTLILTYPNLAPFFPVDTTVPALVADGGLAAKLHPGDNVLVLPAGQFGPGMHWMAELDYSFVMPTGNGGGANPPPALSDPVGAALFATDTTFDYPADLPRYLDDYQVDVVVVPTADQEWLGIAERSLGEPQVRDGGVALWRVTP